MIKLSFIQFCEFVFKRYPEIDGNVLLSMCEVAYAEIQEEEENV